MEGAATWRRKAELLICSGFLILFGLGMFGAYWLQGYRYKETRAWPLTEAVVVDGELTRTLTDEPLARVTLELTVAGNSYRPVMQRSSTRTSGGARRFLEAHPKGRKITVRYNPADPADFYREPGLGENAQGEPWLLGGGGLFVAAGVVWWIVMGQKKSPTMRSEAAR